MNESKLETTTMSIDERIEALRVSIESLHANVAELFEATQKDAEIIRQLALVVEAERESIHELARAAEAQQQSIAAHERRLERLEGGG